MLFTLIADLDSEYRRIALHDSVSYSEQRYTEAAKRYIISRIRERIYVSEVADYVNLSVGYLSNLFKRCTGQTLIEYINITKLNLVKKLDGERFAFCKGCRASSWFRRRELRFAYI